MKRLKAGVLIGVIVAGGAFSVQASEAVHTYEQAANDAYASFQQDVSRQIDRIQHTSDELRQSSMPDIEADITPVYDMSSKQAQNTIARYKEDYVSMIQRQKEQLKEDIYTTYEQDKKEQIQETITEDITDFLYEITQ